MFTPFICTLISDRGTKLNIHIQDGTYRLPKENSFLRLYWELFHLQLSIVFPLRGRQRGNISPIICLRVGDWLRQWISRFLSIRLRGSRNLDIIGLWIHSSSVNGVLCLAFGLPWFPLLLSTATWLSASSSVSIAPASKSSPFTVLFCKTFFSDVGSGNRFKFK